MAPLRRAIAVVLVLLAGPSVVWLLMKVFAVPSTVGQNVGAELLFVLSCLAAAAAAWTAIRLWPLIVLVVAAAYTYAITGPLITGVLLVAPAGYIAGVANEAADRGVSGGFSLLWSLLVLPIAFPALFVFVLVSWLWIASQRAQNASAI